jgi:hypothetical protein
VLWRVKYEWRRFRTQGLSGQVSDIAIWVLVVAVAGGLLFGIVLPLAGPVTGWLVHDGPANLAKGLGGICCVMVLLPLAILLLRGWMRTVGGGSDS